MAVGADGGAALVYVVAGNRAGVDDDVDAEAALTLIDVSNKNSPTIRATQNLWPGGTFPTALEVRGTVAYVLTGGVYPGISVIDVGNPDNLYFINSPGEDMTTPTTPLHLRLRSRRRPDWQGSRGRPGV